MLFRRVLSHVLSLMRADPLLMPALTTVLRANLLEVQWRTGVAERAAELRGRLEG